MNGAQRRAWLDSVQREADNDPRLDDNERAAIMARARDLAANADEHGFVTPNRAQRRQKRDRR